VLLVVFLVHVSSSVAGAAMVMANYIDVVDVDRPGSVFDNNDMNIFQLRL
jgi:hypothetical protein